MKRLILILLLMASPATAGQIDYYLKFADEATALAALRKFTNRDEWPTDYCVPGLQVWRASQDATDAEGNVTHKYLPGFFVLCSFTKEITALVNHAAVQVVLNRDKANARKAGGVVQSTLTNPVLQDIRISPVFAGSDNPYGDMK